MRDSEPQQLGTLAKLAMAATVVLICAGVFWYGVTLTTIQRVFRQLVERPDGPMAFRFILQPCMAAVAAIHGGRKDARLGRSPYVWTILYEPGERIGRLREALNATARIIVLGLVMDAVYQVIVFKRFYPVEAVIIAVLLAFLPYVVLRGIVLRIARRRSGNTSAHQI